MSKRLSIYPQWLGAALLLIILYGCTSTISQHVAPARPSGQTARQLRLELLSVGMRMEAVERIEPKPQKTLTMTSGTMTVVKWVYANHGQPVELYFANGVLQSWTE